MKVVSLKDSSGINATNKSFGSVYFSRNGSGGTVEPSIIQLTEEECYQMYVAGEWVRAVIDKIVDDCVNYNLRVVVKDKSKPVTKRDKDRIRKIQEFFDNPNSNKESFDEIRKKVIRDLLIINYASIEKVNTDDGRLLEVYSMDSKYVRVNTTKKGMLKKTRTYVKKLKRTDDTKAKEKYFDYNQVIFMVLCPSSDSWYGYKKMDTLANSLATDILRNTHNSNYFINGSESSGILAVPGLSKNEFKRFRQHWEAQHKSAKRSHTMAVVNTKDVAFTRMALSNRDLEFSEYGREIRSKVMSVYGMMPGVMGIGDEHSDVKIEEQQKIYKDNVIASILKLESYYYTQEIIAEGFGFTDLEVTFPGVTLDDKKTEAQVDGIDLKQGVITINERRAKLQMPPVPWGDTPITLHPGGPQVDPNTGQLIPPHAQGGDGNDGNNTGDSKPEPPKTPKGEDGGKRFTQNHYKHMITQFIDDDEDDDEGGLFKEYLECLRDVEGNDFDKLTEIKYLMKLFDTENDIILAKAMANQIQSIKSDLPKSKARIKIDRFIESISNKLVGLR